jgi:hypothetical protein
LVSNGLEELRCECCLQVGNEVGGLYFFEDCMFCMLENLWPFFADRLSKKYRMEVSLFVLHLLGKFKLNIDFVSSQDGVLLACCTFNQRFRLAHDCSSLHHRNHGKNFQWHQSEDLHAIRQAGLPDFSLYNIPKREKYIK